MSRRNSWKEFHCLTQSRSDTTLTNALIRTLNPPIKGDANEVTRTIKVKHMLPVADTRVIPEALVTNRISTTTDPEGTVHP